MPPTHDDLIAEFEPVIRTLARRACRTPDRDIDDFLQAGRIGVWRAAERYDASRGVPFKAYAILRIRGAMGDLSRSLMDTRTPRRYARQLQAARHELRGRGAVVTPETLAEALEVSVDRVRWMLCQVRLVRDAQVDYDADVTDPALACQAILSETDGPYRRAAAAQVRTALQRLRPRERRVLMRYFWGGWTLDEIGEECGLSRSRIQQIRDDGLAALRRQLAA